MANGVEAGTTTFAHRLQRAVHWCVSTSEQRGSSPMPKAIDFHVHLPIAEFMDVALGPYRAAAERFFRSEVKLRDVEEIAAYYQQQDMVGVLLAWDAETATGQKPLRNDTVAEIVRRYPQQFIGFASVDPHKGQAAIEEAERAVKELKLAE